MTTLAEAPAQPTVPRGPAGPAAWRVTVLGEADRLEHQLDAALEAAHGPASSKEHTIRDALQRARTAATGKPEKRLRDWWFGTSIESAWQALHLAQEWLVTLQTPAALRAQVPHLQSLARGTFTAQRAEEEAQNLNKWISEVTTPPNALLAQRILAAYHAKSDAQHQQIRGLRNLLYIILAVVVALDCILWATGITTGAIVGLGALAGSLSVAVALRSGSQSGPYNLLPVQTLLKVGSGAATALMAVKILDFMSGVTPSTERDGVYAIIFGFSQQAFTRLVDQHASSMAEGTDARSGHSKPPA
jgi:hypothetical protein